MSTQACKIRFSSVALLTLCLAGMASAQQKYPYHQATAPQSSQYVQQHSIEVGDIPGHQIRIFEIHRVYTSDHPVVLETKVVESWTRGFSDYVNGIGPVQDYSTWVLDDGSKIFFESRGTSYSEAAATGSPGYIPRNSAIRRRYWKICDHP
jgi:hypothetical protein